MRYLLGITLALAACSKSSAPPAGSSGSGSAAAPTAETAGKAGGVKVAAAADLQKAFTEIGNAFKTKTGIAVDLEFGSSGLLAKQIEQGAPFTLFAAANRNFVDQVVKAGKCDGATAHSYARGKIVVWTPTGVTAPTKLEDLADPRFKKIAIANPEHAPYGKAAKQALEAAKVWPQIQDRIVLGENIQATMLYAKDHNADAAIVALSLATGAEGGTALPIDDSLYTPLDQALVVCGTGDAATAAKQFSDFVGSKEGREIMTRYGFTLPDDSAAAPAAKPDEAAPAAASPPPAANPAAPAAAKP